MFQEKIKELRLKNKLTQEGLSGKAGVSYVTVTKIERGVIKNPRIKTLIRIAKALGVSVDGLIKN